MFLPTAVSKVLLRHLLDKLTQMQQSLKTVLTAPTIGIAYILIAKGLRL
jgi:hypothetical protein